MILNAGVPKRILLDGNFVAVTEDKGNAHHGKFSAGSSAIHRVTGYSAFKGSFTVGEGETRCSRPRVKSQQPKDRRRNDASINAVSVRTSQNRRSSSQVLMEAPQGQAERRCRERASRALKRESKAQEEEKTKSLRFLAWFCRPHRFLLLAAAIMKRRRREPAIPASGIDLIRNSPPAMPPTGRPRNSLRRGNEERS